MNNTIIGTINIFLYDGIDDVKKRIIFTTM